MQIVIEYLPDGVSLWAALFVVIAAFFSSGLTAAYSLGGGLALLAVMTTIFPPAAVVPVHGVAQLGSNASRMVILRKSVMWPMLLWFAIGGFWGAALGGQIAVTLPVAALRLAVGFFVLYTVWGPRPPRFSVGPRTLFATGVVSSFVSMFVGAMGPIVATLLSTMKLDRMAFVGTHAACMTAQHSLKIAVFGVLGFAYGEWAAIIVMLVIASYLGTRIGAAFLRRMPEHVFRAGFRWIMTIIGVYLLIGGVMAF
ncbi:MAG: sulfite exporter TauE/SafE family protein [Pseudomonadota bacterium]